MSSPVADDGDARQAGVTAAEHAYRRLRAGIVAGHFPFGARLGEVETSVALGVSRTPLRQALQRLSAEGLVDIVPHAGAQVANWTVHDVEEVYELRICLEPYGAARAASRIDRTALADLDAMCKREAAAIEDSDFDAVRSLNAEFHLAVMAAADNARLMEMTRPLIAVQRMLRTFRYYRADQMHEHRQAHRVLVEAFEAGNPDWAASAMRSHLIAAKERLLQDKKRAEIDALVQVPALE